MASRNETYQQTIDHLFSLQKQGVKLALSNSVALMERMGNPHRTFPSVHIAGTNGKGSTACFLASMLRATGRRVGLYTSPHLVSFTERIRINNAPISEDRVVELAGRVRASYQQGAASDGWLNPTFFEVTTAMAFTYFHEERVDICVVEVGMGGRLDSTNVITPLVSVITNVDLEHTEYLGRTLPEIAGEKAGIIKPGVPVVSGVTQPEVLAVVERTARERRAPLFLLNRDFSAAGVRPGGDHQVFDFRGIRAELTGVEVRMLGQHQVDNATLALAAAECVNGSGVRLDEQALRLGLAEARWEGRLERVAEQPDVILDGAHNPASARTLAHAARELRRRYRKLVLVVGILGDKDYRSILRELVPLADSVIVTRPVYERALALHTLQEEADRLHPNVRRADTVADAVALAKAGASPEDLVLITGSLYIVGEARSLFPAGSGGPSALSGLRG